MMAKAKSLHIITVHGTWARGRFRNRTAAELAASAKNEDAIPWFCEGSKFLSGLQVELDKQGVTTTTEAFEWSGANTLAARATAGKELANRLKKLGQRAVLIAHSHGGNAALTAVRDKAVPPTMLVTMATPFIKLQKIGKADILESLAAWVGCVFAPLLVVYIIWKAGVALDLVSPGGWLDLTIAISGFVSIPAAIVALMVFPSRARRATKFALRNTVCYLPPRHSLLTLRGFDDEAALAIAFGGATSFLARLIDRGLKWLMYFVLMGVGIWVGLAKLALDEQWEDWGANLLFTAWSIGLFALMVTPLAYRATRAFFGHEFLWLGTNLAVVLHSAPDHAGNAELLTLGKPRAPAPGLNHALYSHPDAIREVARWVAGAANKRA